MLLRCSSRLWAKPNNLASSNGVARIGTARSQSSWQRCRIMSSRPQAIQNSPIAADRWLLIDLARLTNHLFEISLI